MQMNAIASEADQRDGKKKYPIMRKKLITTLFSILCILTAYGQNGAKIWIEKDTMELGEVTPCVRSITAEVAVYSIGEESLTLYKAKTDCLCTAVDIDRTPIPPSEYRIVTVKIDIDKHLSGEIVKSIMIYSNADEQKKISFRFSVKRK